MSPNRRQLLRSTPELQLAMQVSENAANTTRLHRCRLRQAKPERQCQRSAVRVMQECRSEKHRARLHRHPLQELTVPAHFVVDEVHLYSGEISQALQLWSPSQNMTMT